MIREYPEVLKPAGDCYRDSRVRSVFAMAPALGPAFPAAGLKKILIPVENVAGESDQDVPIDSSAKYFAARIPKAKLHVFTGNVAHYGFLEHDRTGRKTLPGLCVDGKGVDRSSIDARTVRLALDFFGSALTEQ